MAYYARKCAYCGTDFVTAQVAQVHCGEECEIRAARRMTGRPSWETRGNFHWNDDDLRWEQWTPDGLGGGAVPPKLPPAPPPPSPPSPWEVLELDPDTATLEDVKAAYKTRAKATHPDRVPIGMDDSIRELAETRFKQVRAAYDAILEGIERYGGEDA